MPIRGARVIVLYVLVGAILTGFTFRLMRFQITDGASYRQKAENTSVASTDVEAPRGEILDRYGRVLATNTVSYNVTLQKAALDMDTINDNILKISDILTQNAETRLDTLPVSVGEPWTFNENSDSDIKTLRKFVEQTVDKLPTKTSEITTAKQKAAYAADEAADAATIMNRLIDYFDVDKSYTADQIRIVIGVRYGMAQAGFSNTTAYTFAENVGMDTVNSLSDESSGVQGVYITKHYTRSYPDGTLAPHVVGMVGAMQTGEYDSSKLTAQQKAKLMYTNLKKQGYSMDDLVGRWGIEYTEEKYLRGVDGKQTLVINGNKEIVGTEDDSTAQPGDNVVLTIDSDLQKIMQDELPNIVQAVKNAAGGSSKNGADAKAASAVVLNIKTGEVLAMANYPSYDLNTYAQNASELNSDSGNPLLNRAIQGTYTPGSTFKPTTATAGLLAGVITPTSTIDTQSSWVKGTVKISNDTTNGPKTVVQAIGQSSNYFFCEVADRLYTRGLYSTLVNTAKGFGLGVKTGIELPYEKAGRISSPEDSAAHGETWYAANAAQTGFGQMNNLFTPLQLAQYAGAITTGGKYVQAHIVKEVKSYDNLKTVYKTDAKTIDTGLNITAAITNAVKQGMLSVTEGEDGTASGGFTDFPTQVAGKTGTAEVNNKQNYNALFISYTPFDDPEIAVAVVVELGHNGSQLTPVAKSAFNYYYANQQQWTVDTLPTVVSPLAPAAGKLLP